MIKDGRSLAIRMSIIAAASLVLTACTVTKISTEASDKTGAENDGQRLLNKASASFSDLPFYTTELPENARLNTEYNNYQCKEYPLGECEYFDTHMVGHYYHENLVVKSLSVADIGSRKIKALGIGDVRDFETVLARISGFLDGKRVVCEDVREEVDTGIDIVCDTQIGEGWVSLQFYRDKLLSVQLTSSHFT